MLTLVDVACEGGVAAAGAAGQIARLDRAGVNLLAVINEQLGVVGDHDLLCAPLVQHMCRLDAVVRAGQDFSLGGIGLEVVDERQDFLLVRPVVERHGLVRLNVAQHALNVNRYLAVLCALADKLAVEIAVYQTGEVIHLSLDVRHLVKAERVALAERGAGALLLVGSEILVADGAGVLGRLPVQVGLDALEAFVDVRLLRVELAEDGSLRAAACGRPAGSNNCAAYLAAFVAEIVDIVVERNRADHQYIIFFLHFFFPRTSLCALLSQRCCRAQSTPQVLK